jgi:hypothetical protein
MRAVTVLVLLSTTAIAASLPAQSPALSLQAGLGYARVFHAGGVSLAAALDRAFSPQPSAVQQAVGGSFWYAHTGIASLPNDTEGRDLYGIGLRYKVAFRASRLFRPYLAVPVQLLHSRISDRAELLSANVSRVPQLPAAGPVEDRVGGEWGWGTGLEIGLRVGGEKRLSAQTAAQVLYQDIYDSGNQKGAWNWHAGLSYALGGP